MQSMLPNVLQPTRLTTSPSSRTRCASCSRSSRARRSSTRRSARAATPRCSPATCRGGGKLIAIDRDPTVAPVLRALPPRPRASRRGSCAASSRSCSAQLAGERRARRRDPPRPRRLQHAARSARARLLVRDRRAARHAHGPVGRAVRARARQRDGRARARADLPPLRGGALRAADRARDRRRRRERPFERTGELVDTIRAAIPAPARFGDGHRRSASSRRSGSPSTRSSARSSARCRRRSRCFGRAAGSP